MRVVRARARAGPGSGPHLFRVERDAGHSGPTDSEAQVSAYADDLAFALWQLGHPDFQPPTPHGPSLGVPAAAGERSRREE